MTLTAPPTGPSDVPTPPGRRWRWAILTAVVAVVALLAALLVVTVNDDDDNAGSATSSTSTTAATTPTTIADPSTAVWPYASSNVRYDDSVDAARAFATEFAGFTDPVVGEFQQGDARSGEVEIRPEATGPVTTVFVRQLTSSDDWWVLGSATASIQVSEPDAMDRVSSPLHLSGTSTAFEANVNVEVRADGSTSPIASGFVMGGSNGEMGPFSGTLAYERPGESAGALVLRTFSMKDGDVWEAAVLRVRFAPASGAAACAVPSGDTPGDGERVVKVFYSCGEESPVAIERVVPSGAGVLRAALDALLEGPSADERNAGFTSWFSPATAGMVESVNITADGAATVDFDDLRPVIPNASASAGSQLLLGQLDATVFQFSSVKSVIYRIDGNCEAFTDWLQIGGCDRRTRPSDR